MGENQQKPLIKPSTQSVKPSTKPSTIAETGINGLIVSKYKDENISVNTNNSYHDDSMVKNSAKNFMNPQIEGTITIKTNSPSWENEIEYYKYFPFMRIPLAVLDLKFIFSNMLSGNSSGFIIIYPSLPKTSKYYDIYHPVSSIVIQLQSDDMQNIKNYTHVGKKHRDTDYNSMITLLINILKKNNKKKALFVNSSDNKIAIQADAYDMINKLEYTHKKSTFKVNTKGVHTEKTIVDHFISFVKPKTKVYNEITYIPLGMTMTDKDSDNVIDHIYIVNSGFVTEGQLNYSQPSAVYGVINGDLSMYSSITNDENLIAYWAYNGKYSSSSKIGDDKTYSYLAVASVLNNCSKSGTSYYSNSNQNCVDYASNIVPYELFKLSSEIRDICVKNKGLCDSIANKYCLEPDADKDFCACINSAANTPKSADPTEIELYNKPTCYLSNCINSGYQLKKQLNVSCPSLCVQKVNFKTLDQSQVSDTNINMKCQVESGQITDTSLHQTDQSKPAILTTTITEPTASGLPSSTTISSLPSTSKTDDKPIVISKEDIDKKKKTNTLMLIIIVLIIITSIILTSFFLYKHFSHKKRIAPIVAEKY